MKTKHIALLIGGVFLAGIAAAYIIFPPDTVDRGSDLAG